MAVTRMSETKRFYSSLLGVKFEPIEFAQRTLYSAKIGGIELLLCPKDLAGVDATINTIQLRFVIEDVKGSYTRGLENGGTALTAPQEMEGFLHASLRDPDGNSLEIIEAK